MGIHKTLYYQVRCDRCGDPVVFDGGWDSVPAAVAAARRAEWSTDDNNLWTCLNCAKDTP